MALLEDPFENAIWNALHSSHQQLALTCGTASKYAADVAPFACVDENTPAAFHNLASIMQPGETTYLLGERPPATDSLLYRGDTPCLQMELPETQSIPSVKSPDRIAPLTCADAPAMIALTGVAFPGFFRPRTCVMGNYFGIWNPQRPNELIAMAGERLILGPVRELSGICTHPDHRGQGYAAALTARLLHHQCGLKARSVLHVVAANEGAIHLYHRLGFATLREVNFHRVKRPAWH